MWFGAEILRSSGSPTKRALLRTIPIPEGRQHPTLSAGIYIRSIVSVSLLIELPREFGFGLSRDTQLSLDSRRGWAPNFQSLSIPRISFHMREDAGRRTGLPDLATICSCALKVSDRHILISCASP